jgi:SNF2 family DNA or RNA helicase
MAKLRVLWNGFAYKPHQETGVTWMMTRENDSSARGGILCDEMGLGKTIQMLGLVKNAVVKPREKNLLIAPVAVLEQWKKLVRQSKMTVMVPSTSGMSWAAEGKEYPLSSRIHCIGYEAATRKPWLVSGNTWDRLIYDEAHRIASGNTGTELAERIEADKKWMLTGTPIVNKIKDLSTLLRLIGVKNLPGNNLDALSPLIKKYVLARTMEQLRISIPDAPKAPIHKTIHLDFLTEEEETFYHNKVDIIANRLNKLAGNNGRGAALERLKLIMRLRQVSLHPQIYNEARKNQLKAMWTQPDWTETSTKFEAIRSLVASATESHKWIIFCHFRQEMLMLEELLKGENTVELVQQYHGGLSSTQKEDVLERTTMPIVEGKQEVLLIQLQSGGTGLNLQHFDRIIFTGPWWTSALMQQAVGRAVRIGQTEQVMVYHLHLKAEENDERMNIDRFIAAKAGEKGELCAKVLQSATTAVKLADLSSY